MQISAEQGSAEQGSAEQGSAEQGSAFLAPIQHCPAALNRATG